MFNYLRQLSNLYMLGAVRPIARCYISPSRRHLKHDWINIGSLRLNRVQKHFQWFPRKVEFQGQSRMLKMQNREKMKITVFV